MDKSRPKTGQKNLPIIGQHLKTPFEGIGQPEHLKYRADIWSRRINQEHRLVYKVTDDAIIILACRFHYDD